VLALELIEGLLVLLVLLAGFEPGLVERLRVRLSSLDGFVLGLLQANAAIFTAFESFCQDFILRPVLGSQRGTAGKKTEPKEQETTCKN